MTYDDPTSAQTIAEEILSKYDSYFIADNSEKERVVISYESAIEAVNQALRQPPVVGRSEQLLALAQYMCQHQNNLDGKTAKDYLQEFLSQ